MLTGAVVAAGVLAGAGVAWAVDADLQAIGGRGQAASSATPSVGDVGAPGPAADPSTAPAVLAATEPPSPEPTAVGIDLARYPTTDPASLWVVVNKQHAVDPLDYAPTGLLWVDGGMVRGDVAPDLRAMVAAAKADGVRLSLRNGYRSYRDQVVVHGDVVNRAGAAYADGVSARPGYSEHQTGLAFDLHSASQPSCDLAPCFSGTTEAVWVAAHAWEHGFVVRYTPENTATTGYQPEAWHLRYVGPELAAWMHANGVGSLEEAFGISGGPDYAAG
ncbi:M15 family metallopeptidase [Cellulomonas sp. 73-92]|uniref:M15 family metallopeptidase n=1 Tax=Cellulomonas sp. 73-92 TaxID=1895740 RepID=UPI000B29DF42|nr:D-alanyl-D-alanine carboxypeptidase family protein [Cellulomonas sp. 73-92]